VVLMTAGLRSRAEPGWPELVEVLQKPFELSELAALLQRRLPRR
jgi:hypothetical protein